MNLENMLSDRSQTQKPTYLKIPFTSMSTGSKSTTTECQLVLLREQGRRQWGQAAQQVRFLEGLMKRFWKWLAP